MNERIRELGRQASLWCDQNIPGEFSEETMGYGHYWEEKFAELIVRECVQVGGPEDSYTDEWFKAKADSVNKIREHFGVEE